MAVKHNDEEKKAENLYYYEVGEEHAKGLGLGVVRITHTGSLSLTYPSKFNLPNEEIKEIESDQVAFDVY